MSSATEAGILYRRVDFGTLWAVTAQFRCAMSEQNSRYEDVPLPLVEELAQLSPSA